MVRPTAATPAQFDQGEVAMSAALLVIVTPPTQSQRGYLQRRAAALIGAD
nr:hypothetical protein [Idiomarina aquatica]